MSTVFLSYRRDDTGGEAGRLADALQSKLGRRSLFRDVVSISPGEHFDVAVEGQLAAARIVLTLIGPAWLELLGRRSTEATTDYHRLEVATALREGKRVIPILLRGAALPAPTALPEDLLPLAKCQAMTMRDEAWRTDVERLLDALGRPYRWDRLVLRVVAAVAAITLGLWKVASQAFREQSSDYAFWRVLFLTLVGLYGLVELAIGYRHWRRVRRLRRTAPP
jgi:TIR domain